ncbi:hypothetical protein HYS47_02900 [Candidatus Woesearchaeota archaeon]|nr:hypothetical protein [Candidatus Woesearchaeota archaeon]
MNITRPAVGREREDEAPLLSMEKSCPFFVLHTIEEHEKRTRSIPLCSGAYQ